MLNTYTEDQLAILLFTELGWKTLSASDDVMGVDGMLGRETKSEVMLAMRLRSVLARLNPFLRHSQSAAAAPTVMQSKT